MGPLSVVYDTNVLISGIAFKGKPWQCLLFVFLGDVELVTSPEALSEFRRVMGYEHLPFTEREREIFPILLEDEATIVDPTTEIRAVDDDPDDNKFIECAVEADVDWIVSGDSHLKSLGDYDGIDIVGPASFCSQISDLLTDS